jgi:undecaprenyl-diphosphatase
VSSPSADGDPEVSATSADSQETSPSLPTRVARTLRHLLARLAPEAARSLHRRLGTLLSLALAVSALALWGFAQLSEEVLEGTTRRVDEAVLRWLAGVSDPTLDSVAVAVTTLGDIPVLAFVVVVVSALLWAQGHRREVGVLLTAGVGGALLNGALKVAFGRPRPDVVPAQVEVMTLSFPSGHSMNTMVVVATLVWILARVGASRGLRWGAAVAGALLVGSVGLSRIYLGVHYPTDVAGGFAVGFAWAALSAVAFQLAAGEA